MDSKLLIGLIKELVKSEANSIRKEIKEQVKEELAKLIKSGVVTLNSQKKTTPSLKQISEARGTASIKQMTVPTTTATQQRTQPVKQFTNNPLLNEVLSETQPFSAAHRGDGGMGMMDESSVLDMMQPERYEEDGWDTMDYRMNAAPQQIPVSTGNPAMDAIQKALNRDYTDLAKVFTKQEKDKGLR